MIQSQFVRTHVPGAAFRAVMASDGGRSGPAPSGASPFGPDLGPGVRGVAPPGHARTVRLQLDARVRSKLERIEQQAHAAHAEVLRFTALLVGERQHAQELVETVRGWEANYNYGLTTAMRDQLQVAQAESEAEQQRLTSQRDRAQERWQALAGIAERSRVYLGLPVDDRRG